MNLKYIVPKTQEQIERDRVEYALANPWVLQYDFGHVELIRKYYEMTKNLCARG